MTRIFCALCTKHKDCLCGARNFSASFVDGIYGTALKKDNVNSQSSMRGLYTWSESRHGAKATSVSSLVFALFSLLFVKFENFVSNYSYLGWDDFGPL